MNCRPGRRDELHDAADALRAQEQVLGVDVLAPATGPIDSWALEATCGVDADGVPPTVLVALARDDLAVRDVTKRGPAFRVLATP